MNKRNELLLSRVRLILKRENQDAVEDGDLFDAATIVQDEMFLTASIEKQFNIVIKPGESQYSIADEHTLDINRIGLNWQGRFEIVENSEWNKYEAVTGAHPMYGTIFAQELHIVPKPTLNNDILTIWGEQLKTITAISDNVPPELPELFDTSLLYGICAHYNTDFTNKHLDLLDKAITRYENKLYTLPVPTADWLD